MISVDEISRMTEKKNKLKKETYIKLYEQVSRKIRQSVNFGTKLTVFQVPGFLVGYPMFDRYKATVYIKRQLERGGFNVVILRDNELHITWKIRKVNDKKREQQNDIEEYPTLINLKKAANKYRSHAGKG